MRTVSVNNTSFEGHLVLHRNLSAKPLKCLSKEADNIQKLLKDKDYNLFVRQNYATGNVDFSTNENLFSNVPKQKTKHSLQITAKPSRYLNMAKKTINDYEESLLQQQVLQEKQEQKQEAWQEIIDTYLSVGIGLPALVFISFAGAFGAKAEQTIAKLIQEPMDKLYNATRIATKKG